MLHHYQPTAAVRVQQIIGDSIWRNTANAITVNETHTHTHTHTERERERNVPSAPISIVSPRYAEEPRGNEKKNTFIAFRHELVIGPSSVLNPPFLNWCCPFSLGFKVTEIVISYFTSVQGLWFDFHCFSFRGRGSRRLSTGSFFIKHICLFWCNRWIFHSKWSIDFNMEL